MTDNKELMARIQRHMPNGVRVISAMELDPIVQNLPNVCKADATIYPFAYSTDACDHEMRGAFTNGDPCWEEDDPEAFAEMMGFNADAKD